LKDRRSNQDQFSGGEKSDKPSRGCSVGRGRGGRKVQDLRKIQCYNCLRKIQCYNCEKWGHYAVDYWYRKGRQKNDSEADAQVA